MDYFAPIDKYCERLGPEFWAEPFNAITNLSFIIAGLYWLTRPGQNIWTKIFAINTIIIGIGSFLFHTFANGWSLLADVLPIMILMLIFFFFSFKKMW